MSLKEKDSKVIEMNMRKMMMVCMVAVVVLSTVTVTQAGVIEKSIQEQRIDEQITRMQSMMDSRWFQQRYAMLRNQFTQGELREIDDRADRMMQSILNGTGGYPNVHLPLYELLVILASIQFALFGGGPFALTMTLLVFVPLLAVWNLWYTVIYQINSIDTEGNSIFNFQKLYSDMIEIGGYVIGTVFFLFTVTILICIVIPYLIVIYPLCYAGCLSHVIECFVNDIQ